MGEFTDETVTFKDSDWFRVEESIHINNWMKRRCYDAFTEIMESGVRDHLRVRTQKMFPLLSTVSVTAFSR